MGTRSLRIDRRELLLVEALRTLRLIHYSAWLAQRRYPIFPDQLPWFGSSDYWKGQVTCWWSRPKWRKHR
jgi:Ser/Thr protein kinase RdoA (MazF antagonist)